MFHRYLQRLCYRINRLHIDLQHLVIITFPRTQECYKVYLHLRDDARIFSSKLTKHPVYSKSIISYLDVPTHTTYYDQNHKIRSQEWFNKNRQRHREGDEPAIIRYGINGQIFTQEWYKDGYRHRDIDEPAYVSYHDDVLKCHSHVYYNNGKIDHQVWYKHGRIHRDNGNDGYAHISFYPNGQILRKSWYKNGIYRRDNGKCDMERYDENGNIYTSIYNE